MLGSLVRDYAPGMRSLLVTKRRPASSLRLFSVFDGRAVMRPVVFRMVCARVVVVAVTDEIYGDEVVVSQKW